MNTTRAERVERCQFTVGLGVGWSSRMEKEEDDLLFSNGLKVRDEKWFVVGRRFLVENSCAVNH